MVVYGGAPHSCTCIFQSRSMLVVQPRYVKMPACPPSFSFLPLVLISAGESLFQWFWLFPLFMITLLYSMNIFTHFNNSAMPFFEPLINAMLSANALSTVSSLPMWYPAFACSSHFSSGMRKRMYSAGLIRSPCCTPAPACTSSVSPYAVSNLVVFSVIIPIKIIMSSSCSPYA